jgi:hypothetical protein
VIQGVTYYQLFVAVTSGIETVLFFFFWLLYILLTKSKVVSSFYSVVLKLWGATTRGGGRGLKEGRSILSYR